MSDSRTKIVTVISVNVLITMLLSLMLGQTTGLYKRGPTVPTGKIPVFTMRELVGLQVVGAGESHMTDFTLKRFGTTVDV